MKRVLVIGSCGAGKSTFARRLHAITELPLIHLDSIYHRPNWEEPPDEEWLEIVKHLVEGDKWIIDGNFGGTMELRMEHCDAVVWLDIPRTVCTFRILKRMVLYWNKKRPDMAEGCNERFDWDFIKYTWNFPRDKNSLLQSRLKKFAENSVFRLTTNKEIEKFFSGINQ